MWPFKDKKKEIDYSIFLEELHILCKEWSQNQIGDLPEDELPSQEEINQDILDMRDGIFKRVLPFIQSSKSIVDDQPNDSQNLQTLSQLIEKYKGFEKTTPIFTKLALSKENDPRYKSGWPLCVIRTVGETWFEQSTST